MAEHFVESVPKTKIYMLYETIVFLKILFLVEIRIFADFSLIDAIKLRANERQDVPSYAFGMTLSRLCLDNVFSSHVPHSFFHPLPKLILKFFKIKS